MCHDNRYMSTQNSADGNGSKTDAHEDTVNSYHSDEEAAGSSFMDPDSGSNTSLLITTPATVPISRTPESMSAAAEYAPPTSTPLKMVDETRSLAEIDFVTTKLGILTRRRLPAAETLSLPAATSLGLVQFCKQCIKVQHQNELGIRQHSGARPVKNDAILGCCGQIEKLRLEALKLKIEAEIACADNTAVGTALTCNIYRTAQRGLAEEEFVRYKMHTVGQEKFDSRLSSHLLYRDSASLLAEVIRSCTRPQASTEEIWQAVQKRMSNVTPSHANRGQNRDL